MIFHVRTFRKIRIPAKISSLKVIVQNIANLSNSFHGQTSLKDTIFSVLISEVLDILVEEMAWLIAKYFLSSINLSIFLFP